MPTESAVFNCNVDRRDYLEVEEAFDSLGTIGFEFKGPNIENNYSRIITLNEKQARELIKVLEKALDELAV